MARCNAPPVLESAEDAFDEVPTPVGASIEREDALSEWAGHSARTHAPWITCADAKGITFKRIRKAQIEYGA